MEKAYTQNSTEKVKNQIKELGELRISKQLYILANAYKQSGDYISAMNAYQTVEKSDSNYANTAKIIKEIKKDYINALYLEAVNLIEQKKNFSTANKLFNQAAEYFPKDDFYYPELFMVP